MPRLTFGDLFLLLFVWTTLGVLASALVGLPPESEVPVSTTAANTETPPHPLEALLRARPTLGVILTVLLVGVVIGPITEEFLWRFVLQGTLLRYERANRLASRGCLAVVSTSFLFAARHFRPADAPPPPWETVWGTAVASAVISLLFLALGLLYLMTTGCMTRPRLRRTLRHMPRDLGLAARTFLWIGPITLLLHFTLRTAIPGVVLDPVPLFVFALVLGELARRTGRLTASIALHIMLNATSLALLLSML